MGADPRGGLLRLVLSHPLGFLGVTISGLLVATAVFAPWIAPFPPEVQVGLPFLPPAGPFWLGTNDIGRDILSELIHGTRISVSVGALVAALGTVLGAAVGLLAGYRGGALGGALMRLTDLLLVVPFLPLLVVLTAQLGPSFWTVVTVLTATSWAYPARVVRAQALSLRDAGYVESARALGAATARILWHHILPATLPLLLAIAVRLASGAILAEASLSFLGLGDPTAVSWGMMLNYARQRGAFLTGAWKWWVLPPGLMVALTVLSLALIGYALEEAFNPRLRRTRKANDHRSRIA